MPSNFKALEVSEEEGNFLLKIVDKSVNDLPEGDLLVKVNYSSLNYKDALSITGMPGVTRKYPHTPGIDAVGEVVESISGEFKEGDEVIVSGYDLGMNTSGGFAEFIRVPAEWAVALPKGLSQKNSMALGTAGLTAGLSIAALDSFRGVKGTNSIVTGSSGGVGSISVMLLSQLGSQVTAVSGKVDQQNFLKDIGASSVISRKELTELVKLPINKGLWDIGVDVVSDEILSKLLAALNPGGAVACSGLVGGTSFKSSILPFILRGISLLGIDSVEIPIEKKKLIWQNYASIWSLKDIDKIIKEVDLEGLEKEVKIILKGDQVGRVVLKL